MEAVEALVLFVVTAISMELGILTWTRVVLTSKDSTKAFYVLMFESQYRFFWIPKLVCGLLMIGTPILALQLGAEDDRTALGIAGLCLVPIFCGLVAYEAIRTKE